MSGQITSNVSRSSGIIAPTTGGLNWSTAVVTGSTATVEAQNGYYINTTSQACTVTLPASPEVGDQIVLVDYARTFATNNLIIDSNGNNFQGDPDTYTVDYSTAGQSLSIVYSDDTKGWLPVSDDAVAFDHVAPPTQKAIFGFGTTGSNVSLTNLVNSSGVIAADTTGVGTARNSLAAASYGGDKAIFGFGTTHVSNLVSNSGVVASDTSGVGTSRGDLAACGFGLDKAIFGYGADTHSITNLVSNQGVVASDTTGVGTGRGGLAATGYGVDLGIFGYGTGFTSVTNKVSNTGVVSANTTGVGTARNYLAAARYGGDKALFGYGSTYSGGYSYYSITNLVSNVGVVATDTSGVGTARSDPAASNFGGDKAIFAYGNTGSNVSMSNLVNNVGTVAADVSGVGTARRHLAAAGFSYAT